MAAPTSMSNGSHQMDEQERQVADFLRPLALDEATLHTLGYQFSNVFRELALVSEDQFLPTPVTNLHLEARQASVLPSMWVDQI